MIVEKTVFQCQGTNVGEIGALRSGNGHVTGGVPFVIDPLTKNAHADNEAQHRKPVIHTMTVSLRGRDGGATAEMGDDVATALRSSQGGGDKPYVAEVYPTLRGQPNQGPGRMADDSAMAGLIRRLTPCECERLQGFPDDWTAMHSDSARYRMLGNAVAVPVAEWIGRRIEGVLQIPCCREAHHGLGKTPNIAVLR